MGKSPQPQPRSVGRCCRRAAVLVMAAAAAGTHRPVRQGGNGDEGGRAVVGHTVPPIVLIPMALPLLRRRYLLATALRRLFTVAIATAAEQPIGPQKKSGIAVEAEAVAAAMPHVVGTTHPLRSTDPMEAEAEAATATRALCIGGAQTARPTRRCWRVTAIVTIATTNT